MTGQAPKRGRGRPAPTWKDWAGRLPADYMGAERTRHTRTRTFPRTMHIMHAPYGAPCCTWDSPEPGEMLTICGVEVCDYEDRESWCTEAMKEDSPVIAAPFPDGVKMCRICNARVSKIKDAEPPSARGAEQPAIPSEEGPAASQAPKRGRGRPALGEELKRSRVVKLYMRPEELAEVSSRAEARGLSVSEYLRRRALGLRLPTE